jgi:hypothetical protein
MLKLTFLGIGVVALVAIVVVAASYVWFTGEISREVDRLRATALPPSPALVTEAAVAALPEPAQRYLHHAGVVGQPIPRLVTLRQKGRLRASTADNWMPFEADETYSLNPPAFVWRASFQVPMAPVVLGRDEYHECSGSIRMKMLALLPIADEHGPEMGPAGLMRFLNEMMWFPAGLLGSNVVISPDGDNSFTATLTDHGLTAVATFFVDADGQLVNFRARRFSSATRALETWETPVGRYGELAGLRLPATGSAVWKLPSGDLDYIELEVTGVAFEN